MARRNRPIVALVYDFDGTLSPGNMQEFGFIQAIGKKPQEFWQESDDIAAGQDASNILSYMKLMFDEARKAGIKLRDKTAVAAWYAEKAIKAEEARLAAEEQARLDRLANPTTEDLLKDIRSLLQRLAPEDEAKTE